MEIRDYQFVRRMALSKEKDLLRIEAPLGSFFLREDSNRPIIFMAGGTGFAPIKAIVEHALAEQRRFEVGTSSEVSNSLLRLSAAARLDAREDQAVPSRATTKSARCSGPPARARVDTAATSRTWSRERTTSSISRLETLMPPRFIVSSVRPSARYVTP